ncbi:MAG: DinB family protein [Planctomycetes bacterium]|nr:DinB family protein [Planctomycetota bacterium]
MNRLEHLTRLIGYEDWANREFADALARQPAPEALRQFAHLVSAQTLWLDRIAHRPLSAPVWPEWDLAECVKRLDLVRAGWKNFFRGLDAGALDTTINYVNTKGSYYQSTVGDIISHVLFHGSYHRGSVASALRAAGGVPPTTDFIHAVRTGVLGSGGD